MGCCLSCFNKKDSNYGDERESSNLTRRAVDNNKSVGRYQPSEEEKRQTAALAAEKRQNNWRQGGSGDEQRTERLQMRREKDELIGKIEAHYKLKGDVPPIGLASCDLEQLRKHFKRIKGQT